jgi:2-polyprenyl-3-methyl-5-hydroxy-6-metoxy-1,4-benzoquinol methylase
VWEASVAFYDALQSDWDTYYLEDKWEYQQALRLVPARSRVLDIGCGAGCFLGLAQGRAAVCVGVETAPDARTHAEARGFEVYDCDVTDPGAPIGGGFDVACAFQVLEHVTDPVAFAQAMVDRVKPGGKVVLAVPNAEGSLRWGNKLVSNMPPHHLTTWTDSALRALAAKLGLEVVDVSYEPLDLVHHWGHLACWWENVVLHGRGENASKYTPAGFLRRVGERVIRAGSKAATQGGILTVPWIRGHTVEVVLRKPIQSRAAPAPAESGGC